jgi:mevalonate kinase
MTVASAAGKAILLGEHAVVYGRPAIAVPLRDLRATVEITALPPGSGVVIEAQDLGLACTLAQDAVDDALRVLQWTVRNVLNFLGVAAEEQALRIVVRSQIPIARGLGSGTAVNTALARALAQHYGHYVTSRAISDLVYQSEILLHGTPSGIDNTVVAFEQPVYFIKGQRADPFWLGQPVTLLIADTGVQAKTREAVAEVRRRWQADPPRYEALFDAIGALAEQGKAALAAGDRALLGALMQRNQDLLVALGVSSPELDRLAQAALTAGALGAKLSGGGMGGCAIALVAPESCAHVEAALRSAGAQQVWVTAIR